MKKIYVFGFAALLSTAGFAQRSSILKMNSSNDNAIVSTRGAGLRTVTGSIVSDNNYVAGTTMNLVFTLTTTNTDGEYIDSLALTFPAGFTVNSTTSDPFPTEDNAGGAEASNGVSGQTISWGTNVGNTDNYGGIWASAGVQFDVNVTIAPTVMGTQNVTFFAKGDEYPGTGTGTNGDLSGTISMVPASNADLKAIESFIPSGCSLGNEQVLFLFKNNGILPATGFNLSYIVNGGTPVTEAYTGTVNPGDTVLYTFTTPVNMATPGIYSLDAISTITADGDITNDTASYVAQSSTLTTPPYSTSFENTPATDLMGWSAQDVDGSGFTWGLSATPHTGTQSLRAYENAVAGTSDDWLFSPCLDLNVATVYKVTYWKRMTTTYAGDLGLSLGMAQDASAMTQTLSAPAAVAATGAYSKDSVTFSVATAGTYYLGFEAVNTDPTATIALRLDDINISVVSTSIGINETAIGNVSVYPNPSEGMFTIDLGVNAKSTVEVYNVIGAKVVAKQFNSQTNSLDLTGFEAGVYFVKIATENGQITKQITITK